MLRVSGYDTDKVKAYAQQIAARIAKDPNTENVFLNWDQKNKIMHVDLDQNKLRAMGISGEDIAQTLYTELSGGDGRPILCGRQDHRHPAAPPGQRPQ